MRRLTLGLLLLSFVAASALPAVAAEEVVVDEIDISSHPQVSLIVTLPPSLAGRALPADSFSITEGESLIEPEVERLPNEDLEVVLLLDVSQSMSGAPLAAAVDAATSFAESMPDEARIAIVTFSTAPTVLTEFGPPLDAPLALADVAASGETSLYDGLVAAAALWDGSAASRRAIVLLSDGGDTVSSSSLEDAIVAIIASGSAFYAVELESPETDPVPMSRLEAATGGSVVSADDPDAITSIFDEIASVLVSRYQLTYTSDANGPTDIGVEVAFDGVTAGGAVAVQLPTAPQFSPESVRAPIEVQAAPPEVFVPRVVATGLLDRRELAVFGGAILFAGLWGVIRLLQSPSEKRITRWKAPASGEKALSSFANSATIFAEKGLNSVSGGKPLGTALEQAGSSLRPAEYAVIVLSVALAGAAAGLAFGGPTAALASGIGLLAISHVSLRHRATKRQAAFADQLGDALQLIAGGLLAGHGIIQACDAVASEELEPASEEFRRLIAETRLGRDFTDALRAMGDRVGGDDFRWVVDAIDIHREVGGDLSQVLRTLAATIRSRAQVRRRVETLSAEGKLSGIVLMALPFVVSVLVSISNPTYLNELFSSGPGRMMLIAGAVLMATGGIWIRRIVAFKY
ncbi:MAG: type II secretion system F family protein [Acidimicrobiia bacterium]|nr:type II secretion system F family protein [Acidimicrobiia bacterium]